MWFWKRLQTLNYLFFNYLYTQKFEEVISPYHFLAEYNPHPWYQEVEHFLFFLENLTLLSLNQMFQA